jgi:hypothetical protein
MYVANRLACLRVDHFLGGNVKDAGTQDSDHSENHGGGRDAVLPGYLYFSFCSRDYSELWTGGCDILPLRATINVIKCVSLGINPTPFSGVSRHQLALCATHPHGTFRHCDQWQSRVSLTSNIWFLIQTTDSHCQVSSCYDFTDHAIVEESCRSTEGRLVLWDTIHERHIFPGLGISPFCEGYDSVARRPNLQYQF